MTPDRADLDRDGVERLYAEYMGQFTGWEIAYLLQRENAELEALFELQHLRSVEADEMWRRAHPGNDNIIPDLGDLLEWLMEGKRAK